MYEYPISNYLSYNNLSSSYRALSEKIIATEVPTSIHEALKIPKWKAAVMEEMQAFKKNDTWDIVELPKGKYSVGAKWVFTIELNTIRVLLSLAANLDWPLHQMDVKNAFFNGELDEEVYMDLPSGFDGGYEGRKVCRLKKSLYGMKQSPRAWFDRFTKPVKKYGILRYLKTTLGKGIFFGKNEKRGVEAYTDVDWASSIDDRKSTIGYYTFVWGNLVTWSKKQNVVPRSSAEAEYRALAQGTSVISIAYNPVHHDRTKHVEVDKHFIKERIENGVICMTYVPTTQQIGDILTKGLSKQSFEDLVDKLGMMDIYSPA
ncbi:Retrovirus-related Pol polyprotein from transposon TNT 1-94 [Vitis vinifera]|uniref:Retrovirus-related Pol polyprotein from transposon TNT 1-94 n=1 Tax=Vitis vinifera TaxID=29760 RepID=A0A438GQ98_VITVI|nr:Retrovirus-related Pol polyprotein from transposon TNT 1-94 [Vitis vinifera]